MVAELAARAGLRPPRVRVASTRSVAHVRATRAGAVLVLVLDADRRVLRAVAAHELGHLAARHDRDVKARLWAMVGGAAASGGAVLAATSDLVAAAAALLVVAGLATLHVLRRLRGHELAADRCAVRLLGEADSMRAAL
ncbi:MAG TPA: M48 family metalloprotease, partial [Frankiaceae bacterium]|nr:M48 family metalloprotease [Frankiaceae bacterium]